VTDQGRSAQLAGMDSPDYFDLETKEIVEWFFEEVDRRGNLPAPTAPARQKANGAVTLKAAE
jgi:hypothetical protein